jgi:hypothetical protein
MQETAKPKMEGHVIIRDPQTGEVLLDKKNAIHFENMSIALAKSLAHRPDGHLHEMHFGNGGSTVSGIGVVSYLPPNTEGQNSDLYNRTFFKVIDDQSPLNQDPARNFMEVRHTQYNLYSDIVVKCTLDFNEPAGQEAFDDATNSEGEYIFDEIGLKTFSDTAGAGLLVTHVIFNPVQKSLNRLLEVLYTIRISMV